MLHREKRCYDDPGDDLSYMVGDEYDGVCVGNDPRRDVDTYISRVERRGL